MSMIDAVTVLLRDKDQVLENKSSFSSFQKDDQAANKSRLDS